MFNIFLFSSSLEEPQDIGSVVDNSEFSINLISSAYIYFDRSLKLKYQFCFIYLQITRKS